MQVALDCEVAGEIQRSEMEETTVEPLPLAELPELLRRGGIDHVLVVAALYSFDLWRRQGR